MEKQNKCRLIIICMTETGLSGKIHKEKKPKYVFIYQCIYQANREISLALHWENGENKTKEEGSITVTDNILLMKIKEQSCNGVFNPTNSRRQHLDNT